MRTFILSICSILLLGGAAAYQYPDVLFAPLLSGDVHYEDIFLNEHSKLTQIDGTVMLNGNPAVLDNTVRAGDLITTAADSHATITYFEDSVTRLEPNTSYRITAITAGNNNPLQGDIHGQIMQGTVWNKVIRPLDPDSTFTVSSATTAATIRGSAFAMSVDANGATTAYASEHDLSLGIIDPKTNEIITTVPVPEDEEANITNKTGGQLQALQKEIQANPALLTNERDSIRTKIKQLARRDAIPEQIRSANWYQNQQSADLDHIEHVQKNTQAKKEHAIRIKPDSFLYALQKRADEKQLTRAANETERLSFEIQQLKRILIVQDTVQASAVEREKTLHALVEKTKALQVASPVKTTIVNNDFALLEKGYAKSLPGDRDYLLRTELLDIRTDIQTDPVQKEAFRQRALRQRQLDLQDAEKLTSCGPALLHDIEKEDEYLASLWGAEREYDASGQPIIKDMPELVGTMVRTKGIRLRPGDLFQGFHDDFNHDGYSDYPVLKPSENISFTIMRMDIYRPEIIASNGQQFAWAAIDADKNKLLMQKIIAYYANPDRLQQNNIQTAHIYTEVEVRTLYKYGIRLGAARIAPGNIEENINIQGADWAGQTVSPAVVTRSQPVSCK